MVSGDTEPAVKTFLCVYAEYQWPDSGAGTHQPVPGKATAVTQECVCARVCVTVLVYTWCFKNSMNPFDPSTVPVISEAALTSYFSKCIADLIYDLVVIVSQSQMFNYQHKVLFTLQLILTMNRPLKQEGPVWPSCKTTNHISFFMDEVLVMINWKWRIPQ